jgi:glycerol kinase
MLCASFEDGSVFFWTIDSFSLVWKITLADLSNPDTEASAKMLQHLSTPRYSYFDISHSGELFAYGGLYEQY